jgi:hypothetical protein
VRWKPGRRTPRSPRHAPPVRHCCGQLWRRGVGRGGRDSLLASAAHVRFCLVAADLSCKICGDSSECNRRGQPMPSYTSASTNGFSESWTSHFTFLGSWSLFLDLGFLVWTWGP